MRPFICFPIVALLLFPSCAEFKPCTFSDIESAKILSLSSSTMELELNVKIKNPNNFGFNIYPSDFDISFGTTDIGKARLKEKLHINANSEISYKIVVKSDVSKVLSNGFLSIMAMMKNPVIGIKGELKAGKMFYKKKFPVDFKEKIPLK